MGVRHPHIIVAGPHTDGRYTLAEVSSNSKPYGYTTPVINAKQIVPEDHSLAGWIQLKPVKPKEGVTLDSSNTHTVDLNPEQLAKLKEHMSKKFHS